MAYNTFIPIVNDGLVFHVDAYNRKSYVSGDTVTNDLGPNDFGKYTMSFVEQQPCVSDYYDTENLMFITSNRTNPRQSIYKIDDDLSYKFSSDALYVGGAAFDTTEVVNGLPVMYGGGFPGNTTNMPYFKRYEYQGNDTWSNTFTKNLSNRRHGKINIDKYNTTNGRSDLWLSSSNNSSSTQYLTLHQWSGSDYTEYDFTSKVTTFVPLASKFVVSAVPVSSGRVFVICMSYTSTSTNRNNCIVDLTYTGGTYTDPNNWTTTLIAGGYTTGGDYGDTDGVLGVNKLAFLSNFPPTIYKGSTKNGQPNLYFSNYWATSWGNSINESYIRELFWNGSAWEVTTHVTQTTNFQFSGAINQGEDKFYARNLTTQEIGYYELGTGNFVALADALTEISGGGTELEREPKTIDLINGVGFSDKSWSFDGVNDYIEVPDTPIFDFLWDGVSDFTTEHWVSVNTLSPTLQTVTSSQSAVGGIPVPRGYVLYINNGGNLRMLYGVQGEFIDITTTSSPISINTWYHIVFVKNGTTNSDVTIYVNGIAQPASGSGSYTSGTITQRTNFKLGRRDLSGIEWPINGDISNVRVYGGALTSDEVLQNYNATKWRFQ